jgi:5-hydroxyisourate hydrolase-like protein (transthyretin family)
MSGRSGRVPLLLVAALTSSCVTTHVLFVAKGTPLDRIAVVIWEGADSRRPHVIEVDGTKLDGGSSFNRLELPPGKYNFTFEDADRMFRSVGITISAGQCYVPRQPWRRDLTYSPSIYGTTYVGHALGPPYLEHLGAIDGSSPPRPAPDERMNPAPPTVGSVVDPARCRR